jgi:hypothetical protein
MVYQWENAQAEDYRAGLLTMFFSCLLGLFAIIGWVFFSVDSQSTPASSGDGGKTHTKR